MDCSNLEIDRQLGREALAFLAPLLERAVCDPAVGQSGVLYVVIMHPARRHGEVEFEAAILHEQAYGKPRAQWDADYAEYARKKARVSWSSEIASGDERNTEAWRQLGHAAPLAGGMVLSGIVAAASRADPTYDEVLAGAIALSLRARLKYAS